LHRNVLRRDVFHRDVLRRDVLRRDANFGFAIVANVEASATLEIDKRTGICGE
jgi:hypothetical protein